MSTPNPTRKRRVPDSLRRRTLISCDRCKTRRVRCCRTNENEPCKNCVNSGLACESNLPRKQRVYGSVEKLSLRYRALDALVKGLFPNEDSDDLDTLYRLAQQRSIWMPPIDDQTPAPEAFSHRSGISAHTSASPSPTTPSQTPLETTTTPMHQEPLPESVENFDLTTEIPEEYLVPAPHGVLHYVGRSSSMDFAGAIRTLVAKYNHLTELSGRPNGNRPPPRLDLTNITGQKYLAEQPKAQHQPPPSGQALPQELWETPSITPIDYKPPHEPSDSWGLPHVSPKTRVVDLLPPRELADSLLRTFFNRVHPNFLIFHRASFQQKYESFWTASEAITDESDQGSLCALFMVFAFGAQALEHEGIADAMAIQRRYLRLVRERFSHLAFTASLSNVQALLLLQLHEHNSGERSTGWVLLGLAARMAVALGLHREGPSKSFEPIERNTRRVVWWTLFTYEQSLSLVLGRPTSIDPVEINAKSPDESVFESGEYPPQYTQHFLALSGILNRIKRFITLVSMKWMNQEELLPSVNTARQLLAELGAWETNLPRHLVCEWQFTSSRHRRAVTLMHVYFCHIKTLVTRPYLLCKVSTNIDRLVQQGNPSIHPVDSNVEALAHECLLASNTLVNHLLRLSYYGLLEGIAWVDFSYGFHAVLVLCLDFLARPKEATIITAMDRDHRATVALIIQTAKRYWLASTYQILERLVVQFAEIVGIDCDEDQLPQLRPPQPSTLSTRRASADQQCHDDPVQTVPYAQQFFLGGNFDSSALQVPLVPDLLPELISNLFYYRNDLPPWPDLAAVNAAGVATHNGFIPDTASQPISTGYPTETFDSTGNLVYNDSPRTWTPR